MMRGENIGGDKKHTPFLLNHTLLHLHSSLRLYLCRDAAPAGSPPPEISPGPGGWQGETLTFTRKVRVLRGKRSKPVQASVCPASINREPSPRALGKRVAPTYSSPEGSVRVRPASLRVVVPVLVTLATTLGTLCRRLRCRCRCLPPSFQRPCLGSERRRQAGTLHSLVTGPGWGARGDRQ